MTKSRPTVAAAMKAHPLAPAVLRQLGGGADAVTSAIDAANHGADGGFGGFIYYTETCAFTARNRAAIAELAESMASDLGESGAIALVRGFRCLDKDTPESAIAHALYGGRKPKDKDCLDAIDLVENALAWFALEEVGRAIADL